MRVGRLISADRVSGKTVCANGSAFRKLKGKRMDSRHDIAERGVNQPMPLNPAEPGEFRAGQADAEMALAALAKTGMAAVAFTFIHDLKLLRLERRQSCPHLIGNHSETPFM